MPDLHIPIPFKDPAFEYAQDTFDQWSFDDTIDQVAWLTADQGSMATTAMDALPAIIAGPPAGEADEPKAAQWDNEGYQFEVLEDGWHQTVYGFPDQALDVAAALFPPDVTTDFLAAQPLVEQPWFPDVETEDYGYQENLEGFIAGPPDPDVVTQAAQPHYGELPIPEVETEDYANDSTVDTSWSMDFASGAEGTIGTQPLSEQPWFPDEETQDYANDSLDVTPHLFPSVVSADEYIAAIGLPDQTDFSEPEWEFAPFLEQNEGFLSPNDSFATTIATQYPLAEQPWFPAQDIDTELQNDSTVDVVAQFFPGFVGDAEGPWQKLNRVHQNPGHWDDVSQGRVLRWPP